MPLSNINVDRILSTKEVREMLLEDVWEFDAHIKQLKKRWSILLLCESWVKTKTVPDDRVVVTAWKEGSSFNLKLGNGSCVVFPKLSFYCWLAEKPKLTGLCVEDLESLVCKMEADNVVRVLLDAGFILKLIVYKLDLAL